MPTDTQLLNLASPAAMVIPDQEEKQDSILVKGFASVEKLDRSRDMVDPLEFNIKRFMSAPAIFVNHKQWIDDRGNRIGVGKPISLNAVKLADIDNNLEWGIQDLETKEIINTYPKEKVPELKAGDRGLFIVVEVSEPAVVEKIKKGDLQAFSWRGFTKVDFELGDDGNIHRTLKAIDLLEISLVNVPDNPNSTALAMMKGFIPLYMVRFSKNVFHTSGMVREYMKAHELEIDAVMEDEDYIFCRQRSGDDFQMEKLETLKMSEGVVATGGLLKENTSSNIINSNTQASSEARKRNGTETIDWLSDLMGVSRKELIKSITVKDLVGSVGPGPVDGHTHVAKLDDEGNGVTSSDSGSETPDHEHTVIKFKVQEAKGHGHSLDVENLVEKDLTNVSKKKDAVMKKTTTTVVEEEIKQEEAKTKEKLEEKQTVTPTQTEAKKEEESVSTEIDSADKLMAGISEQVASKLDEKFSPVLKTLSETMSGVAEFLKKQSETTVEEKKEEVKEETTVEEKKEETVEEAEDITSQNFSTFGQELHKQAQKILDMEKSLQAFGKSVPSETTREEKVSTQKTNEEEDPNSCLDNLFGWM